MSIPHLQKDVPNPISDSDPDCGSDSESHDENDPKSILLSHKDQKNVHSTRIQHKSDEYFRLTGGGEGARSVIMISELFLIPNPDSDSENVKRKTISQAPSHIFPPWNHLGRN